jgi:hypothetical protein
MKLLVMLAALVSCSQLNAQDVNPGGPEPPCVEATVTMPAKLMNNHEKRCDMVRELSEKSNMNYRLLAMKIMEHLQAQNKKDKSFLKELLRHKSVAFTVKTDGTIAVQGADEADDQAKPARAKGRTAKSKSKG